MKTKIYLNDKVSIDIPKGISGKLLLQAGSGGGKSFTIRRVLEDSYGTIPHIILDTEGEFASLREKYDYILIGKGQDIVPDPRTAGLMALRLWQEKVSAIIDLYELDPEDRQIFVDNFLNAMIKAPKALWKPVLLVIDEAHEYAPETEKSKHSLGMSRLASKGRKRHIFAIFATQSIALLSKRIVASCKNKLIGYASEINDVKRAAFELGFTPNEALKLRDLDPGEFYAFGPAISKEIIKIKIGPVKTTHEGTSSAKYKVAPPSAKVKAALVKLADLPQQAAEEAKTVAEFKQQITDLTRQLRARPAEVFDAQKYTNAVQAAVKSAVALKEKAFGFEREQWRKKLDSARTVFSAIKKLLPEKLSDVLPAESKPLGQIEVTNNFKAQSELIDSVAKKYQLKGDEIGIAVMSTNQVAPGEMRLLKILAQRSPMRMTRSQLGVLAGVKSTTGTFRTYMSKLKTSGLIEVSGDSVTASSAGIEASGEQPNSPASVQEVIEMWRKSLPPGVAKIFNTIIEAHPNWISRGEVATALGISELTGTFRTYISILKSNKLIETEGTNVKLSEELLKF